MNFHSQFRPEVGSFIVSPKYDTTMAYGNGAAEHPEFE